VGSRVNQLQIVSSCNIILMGVLVVIWHFCNIYQLKFCRLQSYLLVYVYIAVLVKSFWCNLCPEIVNWILDSDTFKPLTRNWITSSRYYTYRDTSRGSTRSYRQEHSWPTVTTRSMFLLSSNNNWHAWLISAVNPFLQEKFIFSPVKQKGIK